MPKRGQDQNEEKQMKPKQIARIVLDVFDNGYIDRGLKEYYTNEETKKKKTFDHDKASEFMRLFKETISEQPEYFVAIELLKALDINPKSFALQVAKNYKDDESPAPNTEA